MTDRILWKEPMGEIPMANLLADAFNEPDGYLPDGRPYFYGTELSGQEVTYYPAGGWSNEGITLDGGTDND